MLRVILINLLLMVCCCSAWAQAPKEYAANADELLRNGDYAEAIQAYEQVLSMGYCSADLYYNLGNAYYRTDQVGAAILNYSRALRINPTMADARENLALAEARTTDRIAELPKFFLARWFDNLSSALQPRGWRVVVVVLLVLVGVALVAFRLGRSRSIRKAGLIGGVVILLLLCVAVWILIASTHRYNARRDAVVMQPSVSVKSSPEVQSADKMVLHEGTRLSVIDTLQGWYRIEIADGTNGWCSAGDIERI